jgi:hypothetical protein
MTLDMIDLSTVTIVNSPDVRAWPVTATITRLELRPTGVHVAFTKEDGADRWPDVHPPGWDGPLQYTLWLVECISGRWFASGIIEFWFGLDESGGPVCTPGQIPTNWCYDGRWGAMNGYQPAVGEPVGFMVTAGDARGKDVHAVAERSQVVVVAFPAWSGGVFTFAAAPDPPVVVPPVVDPPVVVPPVVQPPATTPATMEQLLTAFTAALARLAHLDDTVYALTERLTSIEATLNDFVREWIKGA